MPLSNVFRRLMFAIRFRSTDTFFSPNLTEESRVMMYRRIADRVARITPFLSYDPDPYLDHHRRAAGLDAGRLHDLEPLSVFAGSGNRGGLNYIRNSIKVTIDAYDGTTTYHVVDPADPIAQTVGKVFPRLLKPLDAMPETCGRGCATRSRSSRIQAAMFATFHMTNPGGVLQPRGPVGDPSLDTAGQTTVEHDADADASLLHDHEAAGERGPEYIQMLPFTPRGKDNLAAWMVARSDGANYGKLAVFQFPKQTVIFGPGRSRRASTRTR